MNPDWLWDRKISIAKIQKILKDPQGERFVEIAAILLSRNNAVKEVFEEYLDQETFVKNWNRIKRQMRQNAWNDLRIIFWQAVYGKLADGLKKEGIAIRPAKQQEEPDGLSQHIAQLIKESRQGMNLTQSELAERIGISQQIISRVEKARADVRLLTLEKIARGLNKTVGIDFR